MANREVHLELLLGECVRDLAGKSIGRIQEIRAEKQGDEWVVKEYLVGTAALLERLSAWTIGLAILNLLGAGKIYGGYTVPWDKLDLTDPQKPRLLCMLHELQKLTEEVRSQESGESSE